MECGGPHVTVDNLDRSLVRLETVDNLYYVILYYVIQYKMLHYMMILYC